MASSPPPEANAAQSGTPDEQETVAPAPILEAFGTSIGPITICMPRFGFFILVGASGVRRSAAAVPHSTCASSAMTTRAIPFCTPLDCSKGGSG